MLREGRAWLDVAMHDAHRCGEEVRERRGQEKPSAPLPSRNSDFLRHASRAEQTRHQAASMQMRGSARRTVARHDDLQHAAENCSGPLLSVDSLWRREAKDGYFQRAVVWGSAVVDGRLRERCSGRRRKEAVRVKGNVWSWGAPPS